MHQRSRDANRKEYGNHVKFLMANGDKELEEALEASPYAIGGEEYVHAVEAEMKASSDSEYEEDVILPESEEPTAVPLERILKRVADEFELDERILHEHGNAAREAKATFLELACRLSGRSQRDVGRFLGMTGSAVTLQRKRLRQKLERRPDLCTRLNQLTLELREASQRAADTPLQLSRDTE
jgi:hypothetical protein